MDTKALVVARNTATDLSGVAADTAFVELWLSQQSKGTRAVYAHAVKEFLAFVGKPLAAVSVADLTAYASSLSHLKQATQRVRLMAVKSLLSYGQKTGYLLYNVGAAVKAPKADNTLAQRLLSEAEVFALVQGAKRYRDRVLLKLLYATGLRVSELCALDWERVMVDTEGAVLEVHGKGQKVRYVRIPQELLSELLHLTTKRRGPVFVSQKRTRLTREAVRQIVAKAARRAGLDKAVSPHFLRHSAATHALRRGEEVSVVSATLGHSSLAVTSRYLHANPKGCLAKRLFLWQK